MKSDSVREIKDRLDILELISDYVRLKKVGKNYRGLCPFHSEKTPSFYVSPERQTYHCFGCGAGGDLFSFIMAVENLEFREALEMLASRAGVTLESSANRTSRRSLFEIMEKAAGFFSNSLLSPGGISAQKYLEGRSVNKEMAKGFGIGWSPAGWDNLWSLLRSQSISLKEAMDCGLVIEGTSGPYDRFRGRVMFPVRDISGRVIAFGGRLVDGEGAKYINSPEGVLFHKRSTLYLIDRAKKNIQKKGYAIVVEGYMDAVRMHDRGFGETVASLGTSLTEEQSKLLKRVTDKVYICFDSDSAGQDATIRGMYVLQKEGLEVKVVDIPKGKDPDELLLSDNGPDLFKESIKQARPLVLYHLYVRKPRLSKDGSYNVAVRELLEGIANLPMETVVPYINHLSRELQILPHLLQERLISIKKESRNKIRSTKDTDVRITELSATLPVEEQIDNLEGALCYLLWKDRSFRMKINANEVIPLIRNEEVKMLVHALVSGDDPDDLEAVWHSTGEQFPMQVIAAGGSFLEELEGNDDHGDIIIQALKKRKTKNRFREISGRMIKGIATDNEIREYFRIKQESKDIIL